MEAVHNVKAAAVNIPRQVKVLVAGHPSYLILAVHLALRNFWDLYIYDGHTQEIYRAPYLNRADHLELEQLRHAGSNKPL